MLISYGHVLEEICLFAALSGHNQTYFLIKTAKNKSSAPFNSSPDFTKKLLGPIDNVLNLWPRTLLLLHNLNKIIVGFIQSHKLQFFYSG